MCIRDRGSAVNDDMHDEVRDEEPPGDDGFDVGLLEEELRQAAAILDPVPAELQQIAVEAFALRDLDARIAELTFDSVVDAIPVRGATDTPRMLTFRAGEVTVDVEVTAQGLRSTPTPWAVSPARPRRAAPSPCGCGPAARSWSRSGCGPEPSDQRAAASTSAANARASRVSPRPAGPPGSVMYRSRRTSIITASTRASAP